LIEFRAIKGNWSRFFDVFGKNPLFIFVLSGFLPRVLGLFRWETGMDINGKINYSSPLSWFYEHLCKPIAVDERIGSLVFALTTVFFYWLIGYLLDKKKIYIKV
jgi:predicted acyltransferase